MKRRLQWNIVFDNSRIWFHLKYGCNFTLYLIILTLYFEIVSFDNNNYAVISVKHSPESESSHWNRTCQSISIDTCLSLPGPLPGQSKFPYWSMSIQIARRVNTCAHQSRLTRRFKNYVELFFFLNGWMKGLEITVRILKEKSVK